MKQADFFSKISSQSNTVFTQLTQEFAKPVRDKALLVLNHVVAQEPQAQERLQVYAGRKVMLDTPAGGWLLLITPAGLFEAFGSADESIDGAEQSVSPAADLYLRVKNKNPLTLMKFAFKGEHPPVTIEGDADLAAVFAWLVDNLRWDYAEDLASVIGDTPAQLALDQVGGIVHFVKGLLAPFSQKGKEPK